MLVAALGVVSSVPVRAAGGVPPVRLVYDTKVTVHVQLSLRGPEGILGTADDVLNGLAGETMILDRTLGPAAKPLRAALTIVPYPDESGTCRLEVRSEVSRSELLPSASSRTLTTASERLSLVDLWTDRVDRLRLVAAFSVRWEVVPRLTTLLPESEPVDLVFELFDVTDPAKHELLERHRLGGIVGAPSRYTFAHAAGTLVASTGRAQSAGGAATARLALEALPQSIADGLLTLALRLQYEQKDPARPAPALDLSLSDRVPNGSGVELALPRKPGEPALLFKVTPYF